MHINKKLLPIKLHYFFFMAAVGPILPQLPLLGKDLGISPIVMGTVTGILPITYLLTKPVFGILMDVYRKCRKPIFVLLILIMTSSYIGFYFIPLSKTYTFNNQTTFATCDEDTTEVVCNSTCLPQEASTKIQDERLCKESWVIPLLANCVFICTESQTDIYASFTFWIFIILMSIGTIAFNVVNSTNDGDYGAQRLWGSIGFGITGLISGYAVDYFSTQNATNYRPIYVIMAICTVLDMLACYKLDLPVLEAPKHIFKDLKMLLSSWHVVAFLTFTVLIGMIDGVLIYFMFWYLEDLAVQTDTTNIKLVEGLILGAETLGAEIIFFFLSGKILQKLGHVHSFTLCFFNYALRSVLIAVSPNPWWILVAELFMQGPTFALTYTAIVAYANDLAPQNMSATMQGVAAGMGDGTGFALGSVIGGLLYKYFGGRITFLLTGGLAVVCGCLHFLIQKFVLKETSNLRKQYEQLD